jgi:O-succinylbenzoate synthase
VLSSSYESSLGTGQIAALAQELTPDEPPGLDTQRLFGADLLRRHTDSPSDHHKPVLTLSDLECLWQA